MPSNVDPEAAAIQHLTNSLEPLDEAARVRVLEWALKRYRTISATVSAAERVSETISGQRPVQFTATNSEASFGVFADLYDATRPDTDAEKALIGGYWLQVCQKAESFPSRDVNELLKNQGHPIGNITRAFDALRESRPAYVSQLEKAGKTKQARKKLKLTTAGIRKVEEMMKSGSSA